MTTQAVSNALAEFPERPTKDELLDSLFRVLEDIGQVYDFIDKGDDRLLLDEDTGILLAGATTRLSTIKSVLSTIAYLEHKQAMVQPRLIVPG